jgi:hypothetical protein
MTIQFPVWILNGHSKTTQQDGGQKWHKDVLLKLNIRKTDSSSFQVFTVVAHLHSLFALFSSIYVANLSPSFTGHIRFCSLFSCKFEKCLPMMTYSAILILEMNRRQNQMMRKMMTILVG